MSVAPNGYKQKANHVIVSCPCGYRHRYPLSTSTAYLMDQCDLHDEICAASARNRYVKTLAQQGHTAFTSPDTSGSDLNNAQT